MDFRPKTIRNFLKEVSLIGNVSDKVSKFDSFVKQLEEEMKKIDAFRRELPLSMLLLNDAIVALKEESMQCVGRRNEPVLEEFLPLKENCNNQSEEDCKNKNKNKNCNYVKDKKNWMSSVQLWNTDEFDDKQLDTKKNNEDLKSRGKVKGFSPFQANSSLVVKKEEKGETLPVHGLTLLIPGIKNPKVESACIESRTSCSSTIASARANYRSGLSDHHHRQQQQQQQQSGRKQRRCWSSELHRRFVNALQQLGGSQAATPKQIRELMQVDGLTNDEVKSHLQVASLVPCSTNNGDQKPFDLNFHGFFQKYRLHSRRNPSSTTASADQSTIVLGNGRWMSRDQYEDSSKASSSQSGSPQGPLQLATNTGGTSTTGGDSTEDDEDMRSEAYSWKSRMHKPGKDYV